MSTEITAATTMGDILSTYPGAKRALFAAYHIGGCSSCAYQDDETLGEVCARNEDLPVAEVVDKILTAHESDQKILISPESLAERLNASPAPKLLDLRTREEYEAVQLPNAELFTNELTHTVFGSWEKDTAIVVYDHTGDRCLDAAAYFIGHGFENTKALRGGIDAYAAEVDQSLARYKVEFE